MAARNGALRITLAFLLAPVGAVAFCYVLAWLLLSGRPIHLSIGMALQGIMIFALVSSPVAYAVEAVLLLAFGVRPPSGWRGVGITIALGMVAGALTLGALGHFSEHAIGEGLAWYGGAGAVFGGIAASVYVLIVEGLSCATPARFVREVRARVRSRASA